MSEQHEFEWYLQWDGRDDTPRNRAAVVPCTVFNIWKEYNLKLISYEEYVQMVEAKLIAPPQSYWKVEAGQFALALKSHLRRYDRDLENLSNCYQDFLRGWDACESRVQMLLDWDEALDHVRTRKKWFSKQLRRYEFHAADLESGTFHDWQCRGTVGRELQKMREHDFVEGVVEKGDRRGRVWYVLSIRSTGPEFLDTLQNLNREFSWIFAFRDAYEDPTDCECKPNSWGHLQTHDRIRRDPLP